MPLLERLFGKKQEELVVSFYEIEGNLQVSTKPYFIKKDRGQGEKEFADIALTSNFECCFVYSSDNNCWFNIVNKAYKYFDSKKIFWRWELLVISRIISGLE